MATTITLTVLISAPTGSALETFTAAALGTSSLAAQLGQTVLEGVRRAVPADGMSAAHIASEDPPTSNFENDIATLVSSTFS